MISIETTASINPIKNQLFEIFPEFIDEIKFLFDKGVTKHVESIREKFIKTKTFLYQLEQVDFYDIYFPISLSNNSKKNYLIENIDDLFKETNNISIIGNAGSGKSMLIKHIFLNSVMQKVKIPIVIELRNLNDYKGSFFEYLINLLSSKKLAPNKKILERILSKGKFLFLFDGYDEIYSKTKEKKTSELIDFIDNYSKNSYVITSRPGASVEALPRFNGFYVDELSIEQIKEFTALQLKNFGDDKLCDKIIAEIDKPENNDYKSYLSSPLLLSMFILTFQSYPQLPKSKSKFYWNVFDTLCTKHDSFTKLGGYQHERKSGLQNEEFENVLKWFSYISLFKGKYIFDEIYFKTNIKKIRNKLFPECSIEHLIEDLTTAISIILIDGLDYKFPHKSFQEYFSALLIKEQKEEIKKEIYTRRLDMLYENSNNGCENFWSICSEVDPIAFNKYFILRHLEKTINNNELFTDDQIEYKSLIQAANQYFYLYDEDGEIKSGFLMKHTIIMSIIEFIRINFNINNNIYVYEINLMDTHSLIWNEIKKVDNMKLAFSPKDMEVIPYKPVENPWESFLDKHEHIYFFNETNIDFQDKIISRFLDKEDTFHLSKIVDTIKNIINDLKREINTYEQDSIGFLDL